MEKVLSLLKQKRLPSIAIIKQLCFQLINVLIEQPNVLRINPPVYVIGDLYGQFYDLLELIQQHQDYQNYLFLGNYINRGQFGLETLLFLYCHKIKYRKSYTLLRGNHQSLLLSQNYGFYDEIYKKYGNIQPWKILNQTFAYLPVAAIINEKYFAVHSGISQSLIKIDSIRSKNRIKQNPQTGGFYQLLWNEPNEDTTIWTKNEKTYGKYFGLIQIEQFCHINKLKGIIRSNNILKNGYQYIWKGLCTTISSCPNYLHKYGNCGTINLVSDNQEYKIKQFDRVVQEYSFELQQSSD